MYSKDGSFGRVRLAGQEPPDNRELYYLHVCGWHACNDQYCIQRAANRDALFLYTVSGQGEMNIDGQEFSLTAGTLAYIPQNALGYYRTPKGGHWEFYWVHPAGERAAGLLKMLGNRAACRAATAIERYAQDVEELLRLCARNLPLTEVEISMVFSRLLHRSILDLAAPKAMPTLAERALNYISVHMSEPLTLPQIADALFVSQAHLGRVFKAEWGMTPHQYLTQCRLRAADRLLKNQELSVADIASLTGFYSSSHLVHAFKKVYGTTPARYRKR